MKNNRKNLAQTLFIIFLFLINFLVIFYIYFYLYHDQIMSLTAELDSLIEKNRELKETLTEILKKLKRAEQGKR
ncbi:hypothetical protein MHU86_9614 (mitochondrion) [Fragilaria crotonensis]|nr:hypothetical protein MHU86_9614 [Fragilaria crotonensis]